MLLYKVNKNDKTREHLAKNKRAFILIQRNWMANNLQIVIVHSSIVTTIMI